MKQSPFRNKKLDNNNIEKIAWLKLPVRQRLEQALSWGKEIDWIHQKLYGKAIKLKKIKDELIRLK